MLFLLAALLALDKTNLDKVKERNVTFNAFTLVHTDEVIRSWGARMDYLEKLGFITVEREHTDAKNLPDAIARWTKKVDSGEMGIPVDGLVITYDRGAYQSHQRREDAALHRSELSRQALEALCPLCEQGRA